MGDFNKPATHSRDHRDDHLDPISGPWFPVLEAGADPPDDPDAVEGEDYVYLEAGLYPYVGDLDAWSFRRGLRVLEVSDGALGIDTSTHSSGVVAFTMPAAYRPQVDVVLHTAVSLDLATTIPAQVTISATTGDVVFTWSPGAFPPVPWFRRSVSYAAGPNVNVTEGSDYTIVEWDEEDGSDDYASFFQVMSTSVIRILVTGVYELTAEILWDIYFPDVTTFFVHDEIGFPTAFSRINTNDENATQAVSWRHRWTAGTDLSFSLGHEKAGDTQSIEMMYVELFYVGPYTGPNPEDQNPDQ